MQVALIPLAISLELNYSLACAPGACVVARGLMRDIPGRIHQCHTVRWRRMMMYNNQNCLRPSNAGLALGYMIKYIACIVHAVPYNTGTH